MKIVLCAMFLICNVSFAEKSNKEKARDMYLKVKNDFKEVSEIKLSKFRKLSEENKVQLVDVRKEKERDVSMISGAISKNEFEKNIKKYEDKIIVVYCTIGYRSAKYIKKLKKKNVLAYNLEGSILGWVHEALPVVNPTKEEVKRVHVYGRSWNVLPKDYEGVW